MSGRIHKEKDVVGDRYKVIGFVGEGGMQQVFAAHDLLLDRVVALKGPKEVSEHRLFKRSAVAAAKVNHHNVAKTLDYVVSDPRPYLVEELIDGRDLGSLLRGVFFQLPPSICARSLHQLAMGLSASHEAGVIHRDIKPSNIMAVGGERFTELKITDFGIAKMAEDEIERWAEGDRTKTQSRTVMGAIPYMAPESVLRFKDSGRHSDVWGVAAVVFELLAGEKPFGEGLGAIPSIVGGVKPDKPVAISKAQFRPLGEKLYEILLSCFELDPADRPTAEDLVEICEKLIYPNDPLELGTVSAVKTNTWGFMTADQGSDLFWHRESFYGPDRPAVGDRVCFSRHTGGGNDRAFPLAKLRQG